MVLLIFCRTSKGLHRPAQDVSGTKFVSEDRQQYWSCHLRAGRCSHFPCSSVWSGCWPTDRLSHYSAQSSTCLFVCFGTCVCLCDFPSENLIFRGCSPATMHLAFTAPIIVWKALFCIGRTWNTHKTWTVLRPMWGGGRFSCIWHANIWNANMLGYVAVFISLCTLAVSGLIVSFSHGAWSLPTTFTDPKKAIACQLFAGTRKVLPDGSKLRGPRLIHFFCSQNWQLFISSPCDLLFLGLLMWLFEISGLWLRRSLPNFDCR